MVASGIWDESLATAPPGYKGPGLPVKYLPFTYQA